MEQELENIVSKQPSKFWEESDERVKEKETLEEVAREYYRRGQLGLEKAADTEMAFLRGANWQKEQMCGDEDMMFAYEQGARLALISQSPLALHKGEFPTPKEWFEQFKKK